MAFTITYFDFCKDAIRNEHGREMGGSRIVVEWARGPKVCMMKMVCA